MLKYLIIQLCDSTPSFCHYSVAAAAPRLIPLDTLRRALRWAMTENLSVQLVYPDRELPAGYKAAIDTVDHADIVGSTCADAALLAGAAVVAFGDWAAAAAYPAKSGQAYVVRTTLAALCNNLATLAALLTKADRVNVVIVDVEQLADSDLDRYRQLLDSLVAPVKAEYAAGHAVQLNLLTDRMQLTAMNNCNAGWESLALAPDGRFYPCPGFYHGDGAEAVGDIDSGPAIPNQQLYRLDHAPICRRCDAWQCRRCAWLNQRTTLEVNTPSRQQCVLAHHERNASRSLLAAIRQIGEFLPDAEIPEVDYLDPFDKLNRL